MKSSAASWGLTRSCSSTLSGRGDKDVHTAARWFGLLPDSSPDNQPYPPRGDRDRDSVTTREGDSA
jgi:hypothetical protein